MMNEEEIGLLHTLSKMPDRSWLQVDIGAVPGERIWPGRLIYEGYIRFATVNIEDPDGPCNVVQLTEAGRFYVRSTPEAA